MQAHGKQINNNGNEENIVIVHVLDIQFIGFTHYYTENTKVTTNANRVNLNYAVPISCQWLGDYI